MGGAPFRKCIWINVNAHDDVTVGLESLLHFLGNLQPLLPGARHLIAIGENFQKSRVIFLVDPKRSYRWGQPFLQFSMLGMPVET